MADLTPTAIWQDDLFGRQQEAENVIAFLESVAGRKFKRDDKQAYTLAIEAGYGEGKSFFLRRLAEHVGINHPVAFVDAWSDDLANDPFTALVATLESALGVLASEPNLAPRVREFKKTAGRVLKIAGAGLIRRGAGLLIGATAVDALEDVISELGDATEEAVEDKVPEVGMGIADDVAKGFDSKSAPLMNQRIAEFREGKSAVAQLKLNLTDIVSELKNIGKQPPIFIMIDELDRCRPTYAVKLLEEIKHLFDVPGLVFVLSINSEQLSHSVVGAYGPNFDGRAYLGRFIDREYRLSTPDLIPLLNALCESSGLNRKRYIWEHVVISQTKDLDPTLPEFISFYMNKYGLTPRDAFKFMDILQTCEALIGDHGIYTAYLFPLIIGHIKNLPMGTIPPIINESGHCYARRDRISQNWSELSFSEAANEFSDAAKMTLLQLDEAIGNQTANQAMVRVRQTRSGYTDILPVHAVDRYPQLIGTVARFSNPQLDATA